MSEIKTLGRYAKQAGWPAELQQFLTTFLADFGVGGDD